MSRVHLSERTKWQDKAALGGLGREETAKKILGACLLENPTYLVEERPKYLLAIYNNQWGIQPDFSIKNRETGNIAFFETKRQGTGGNAHERACKYFAPGIQGACAEIAGFEFPFFFIFMNGLTTDPKKRAEITKWFDADGYRDRCLLWGDRNLETLIDWFHYIAGRYLDESPTPTREKILGDLLRSTMGL